MNQEKKLEICIHPFAEWGNDLTIWLPPFAKGKDLRNAVIEKVGPVEKGPGGDFMVFETGRWLEDDKSLIEHGVQSPYTTIVWYKTFPRGMARPY